MKSRQSGAYLIGTEVLCISGRVHSAGRDLGGIPETHCVASQDSSILVITEAVEEVERRVQIQVIGRICGSNLADDAKFFLIENQTSIHSCQFHVIPIPTINKPRPMCTNIYIYLYIIRAALKGKGRLTHPLRNLLVLTF